MDFKESTKKKIDELIQALRDENTSFVFLTSTNITFEMLMEGSESGGVEAQGMCAINGNGVEFMNMIAHAICDFCKGTGAPHEPVLKTIEKGVRDYISKENPDVNRDIREDIIKEGVKDFIERMKKKFKEAGMDIGIEAAVVSPDEFNHGEDIHGDEYQ